jgi:ribosomal protein S18 acetylase RimI-like enzyme
MGQDVPLGLGFREIAVATKNQITVAPAADEARAVATITMAFSSDPAARWLLPDANQYLTYWPSFVRAFAGGAFANGTADSVDDCGGVAMWLPPGVGPDDEVVGEILAEAVPAAAQEEALAFFGQMEEFHPTDRHWYLPLIGVDVTRHGRGFGSALLRHALERCDRDRLPAYLEATSHLNRALYARHGFEEIGVIQTGSSPPM